ncbi:MAG TPA: 2-C-methyl-D-erythritol 4-phosphate cytidylyltransferase [Longimicrobiales bacterium]|nr:2-C-methyl-D-erythritol 4-phosphate cytidylyltransferase [Longimicrobiales bacterium]
MKAVGVIIPAGGAGRRMGGISKPFIELGGEPVLARSLRPFLARPDVRWVVVALPASVHADPPDWLRSDPRTILVVGGAERSDSVRNALAALPGECDIVLVHDAARPMVDAAVIQRCVEAAAGGVSALAAVPVTDTIKEVDDGGRVVATPDRRRLRAAQTPQAFPAGVLRMAHDRAAREGIGATDDAALVARYGATVVVVDGTPENLKITTPADLAVAEALLQRERS